MKAADITPGVDYHVDKGYPTGRLAVERVEGRYAFGRFPDSRYGSKDALTRVHVGSISARWDDPKLVQDRNELARQDREAGRLLGVLSSLGLRTLRQVERDDPRPQVIVTTSVRWGATVQVDLDALVRNVLPILEAHLVGEAVTARGDQHA